MHISIKYLKQSFFICAGLVIYLLFFISVAWTGWFNVFFSGAALHYGAKGIDFYCILRGAWGFWHGTSLVGNNLPAWSPWNQGVVNLNVYHPLFTLTLGSLLTLFGPTYSPYVWLWIKLPISLLVIGYFFWNFRSSKHIGFAIFTILANASSYLELAAWQYHFVLNMFLMLFFVVVIRKRSFLLNGLLYWLGMLIKPVGLLFLPVLLFKGRWRTAILGTVLFIASTAIFFINRVGNYYTDNLYTNFISAGILGPNQIITLSALLHFLTRWPDIAYHAIEYAFLAIVTFLSSLRRTHIAKAFFLYITFYLCFYNLVYEYQWSTLAYVLAVCIVTCPEFQTRLARFCILLTCLPDCFFLLNHLHIDIQDQGYLGLIPGDTAWKWMVVSKLVPLFLLLITVLYIDVKPIFAQMKVFWKIMRKVNNRLEVFGEQGEMDVPCLTPELVAETEKEVQLWASSH